MNKGKTLKGEDIHSLQNTPYSKTKMTNVFQRKSLHWHMINSVATSIYVSKIKLFLLRDPI